MWNRPLVHGTFIKEDAEKILRMPISVCRREDKIAWIHSKDGQYLVTTSYKKMMQKAESSTQQGQQAAGPSVDESDNNLWKTLWNLNIKHNLKIFIRRCINNTLPTKENIFRKKKGDTQCKECGEGMEIVEHIFYQCSKAQLRWELSPINWDGMRQQNACFKRR